MFGLSTRILGFGLGGMSIIAALLLAWGMRVDSLRAHYKAGWEAEKTEFAAFKTAIVDKTAEALAKDRANAARTIAEQDRISKETTDDYQAKLAAARAAADRLRAQARLGSGGKPDMPSPGQAAGGPDGASAGQGFSIDERLIATEQAIQLEALQNWVRQTSSIPVEAP